MSERADISLSRRRFLRTGIALGAAFAVDPFADAAAIHTDSKGLIAGDVHVKAADGVLLPAYRAFPADSAGPFSTVVIVHDDHGADEHVRDLCRRLAKVGYYAIAPGLFFRQSDTTKQISVTQTAARDPDTQVFRDLDATLTYAALTGKADPHRAAVAGFSWGGRIAWLYAWHNPSLKAAAAWYGVLTSGPVPHSRTPIAIATALKVPVIGLYGGKDPTITSGEIDAMRAALAESTSHSTIIVYPDVGHDFNADDRPSYNGQRAGIAWGTMLTWFKSHGLE